MKQIVEQQQQSKNKEYEREMKEKATDMKK
jgi:hypothetical protein